MANNILKKEGNLRIKDIARLAGVSEGTVDRVLHNRGNVSDTAYAKVNEVLNKINYKPNLIARSLGRGLKKKVAVLIIKPNDDPYWNAAHEGIIQAREEWQQYGVTIETYFYLHDGDTSIEKVVRTIIINKPDGVVLAPLFHIQALHAVEELKENHIPYVLFNANIPESSPLGFIGQDLYQSGKLAGFLCSLGQHTDDCYAILSVGEDTKESVYLMEKERGFREFYASNFSHHDINSYVLEMGTPEFYNCIDKLLADDKLKGIYVTTSNATSPIAEKISNSKRRDIRLIGYDLLDNNLKYLEEGIISFLISQNPKKQAFRGIGYMVNYLLFNKEVPQLDLFPLEIISQHNVDSYIDLTVH
ncbi:MAG: substrate-binding domain-containing protein [Cyclobacteriaceae bacterium]